MLTHRSSPISLSLISTDLPVWSVIETAATLYQKESQRFHLIFSEPAILESVGELMGRTGRTSQATQASRLVWLEISPYRVIMTMQGNGQYSYRHLWERGMYGTSRFWLQNEFLNSHNQVKLRNFTRQLELVGKDIPEHLRLEYELWSDKLPLGRYILTLEIHH